MLGLVLLAAVAFKGYEVATEELVEDGLLTSRWFLTLAVEWEILFALWLLGGFYRFYPRATRAVALLYFLALFEVSLDSFVKGRASCSCFGKVLVPPWVSGSFNLTALILLVAAPLPPASRERGQWYCWFGLAAGFGVFGLLALITMVDHSTVDATPAMRGDRQLGRVVTIQRLQPTTEDLLNVCRSASGLSLTADPLLLDRQPRYGVVDLKDAQLWVVMELVGRQQEMPARWEKVDGGYALVRAAPFGKRLRFWFNGVALLFLCMITLRSYEAPGGRIGPGTERPNAQAALGVECCAASTEATAGVKR
jgi:hypothetical protein